MTALAAILARSQYLTESTSAPDAFSSSSNRFASSSSASSSPLVYSGSVLPRDAGIPELDVGLEQLVSESGEFLRVREVGRNVSGGSAAGGGYRRGRGRDGRDAGDLASAAYLLGSQGVNLQSLEARINHLLEVASATPHPSSNFQSHLPATNTTKADIPTHLRLRKAQIILATIAKVKRDANERAQRAMIKRMREDWEVEKRRVIEEMGGLGGIGGRGMEVDRDGMDKSTLTKSIFARSKLRSSTGGGGYGSNPSGGGSLMGGANLISNSRNTEATNKRMMEYDVVVKKLNSFRKKHTSFALLSYLSQTVSSSTTFTTSSTQSLLLHETYTLLSSLAQESNVRDGRFMEREVVERAHARAYLDKEGGMAKVDLNRKIQAGGRRWLEEAFGRVVKKTLDDNMEQAKRGGVPGIRAEVKAYANFIANDEPYASLGKRLERVSQSCIWMHCFYLLRAGQAEEVLVLLKDQKDYLHSKKDKNFVEYYETWFASSPDPLMRRLTPASRDALMNDWNSRVRGFAEGGDPFKYAMWKIVGRLELNKKSIPYAIDTWEDWMWLQLVLAREPALQPDGQVIIADAASERYTLSDVGKLVVQQRQKMGDKAEELQAPLNFFQQLVLTGQFELAVAYITTQSDHYVDGVHMAIALAYYGLLRVPARDKDSDLEIYSSKASPTGEVAYLNFGRLVQRYVKQFAKSDAATALQYIYLVALNKNAPEPVGSQQQDLCIQMLSDLIVDTESYNLIISPSDQAMASATSTIQHDLKLVGVTDERAFLKQVAARLASKVSAESSPVTWDLIRLYGIAGESEKAVSAINISLSSALSKQGTREQAEHKDPLCQLAEDALTHLKSSKLSDASINTCRTLLNLKEAKRLYELEQWGASLAIYKDVGVVPLDAEVTQITRHAENFKNVDENLARNIGQILVSEMTCLYKLQQALKENAFGTRSKNAQMVDQRRQSRALMMFAGMIRYRMSSEVYQQLSKLDAYF